MKGRFSDWSELRNWLDGRGMFHMELGLERMYAAMSQLDLAHPPFLSCQVLGTNGKGSTCAFLDSLLRGASQKTGLYISPHLLTPRERIVVDGKMAGRQDWLDCANELAKLPAWPELTYFEFITLLALLIFRKHQTQMAIFEAGLGGKNDATTAIPIVVQCFTAIAMDHAAIIGPALEDIAGDKAAAMRPDVPVFSTQQFPVAAEVLEKEAARKNCRLTFCPPLKAPPNARLQGNRQAANMSVALAAAKFLLAKTGAVLSDREIDQALANAWLPGRRQFVKAAPGHPAMLLDGAHNPHALNYLAADLPTDPGAIVFSCLADKDWRPGLAGLARAFPQAPILIPQLANARAAHAEDVAVWINGIWPGRATSIKGADAVPAALAQAKKYCGQNWALAAGSFFLLAEIFSLYPEYLENRQ